MPQSMDVIGYFDDGYKAMKKKQYLLAAYLFRLCKIIYENGELGEYLSEADFDGRASYDMYQKCLRKLPDDLKNRLDKEEKKYVTDGAYFIRSWEDFMKEDRARVEELYKSLPPESDGDEEKSSSSFWHSLGRKILSLLGLKKNQYDE